ncbi:MAG: alpha/beta hydrolase fold domain-containing protein, partial [Rhodospirillaceae bacterium]|nr:alpha/beta hydrolase fold domain-containing protein [Rhodospirillaceae bacterium]
LYPSLDLTASSSSHRAFGAGFGLDSTTIEFCYRAWASDAERRSAAASPALRADLAGAAPAIVAVGDFDPLRDEALDHARRLGAAGIAASVLRYPRMVHGFISMPKLFPDASRALADVAGAAAQALAAPRAGAAQAERRADKEQNTTTRETRRD